MGAGISNASFGSQYKQLEGKTIIWANQGANNTAPNMYTIGAGKTFYIVAAGLSYNSTVAGIADVKCDGSGDVILKMVSPALQNTQSLTITFPQPIPVYGVQNIEVESSAAGLYAYGWIIGWEE